MAAQRGEYNRLMTMHVARVRDFEVAYFALQRHAGAFWDTARALPRSVELAHLIALFRARGEIAPQEGESLPPDAWRALLTGLGVRSEEHTSELQSLMRSSYAVFCLKKKNN